MPKTRDTDFVERMGVHHTGDIFARAGVIFRETQCSDTGIDAEIELVHDGYASGQLAKLQIRSGDSRLDLSSKTFKFSDNLEHYEYWARYTLPTIGVVYSPSLDTAVWFDLSEQSRHIVSTQGPYTINIPLTNNSRLDVKNISGSLSDIIESFSIQPASLSAVKEVSVDAANDHIVGPDGLTKEQAWKYLTNVLLTSDSASDVRAEAGYRLSLYFPAVSEELQKFFVERISNATDKEIANIVIAIQDALSSEQDDVADLIIDLLSYMPYPVEKLKEIGYKRIVSEEALEALIQSVEVMSQEFDSDFRNEILNIYRTVDTSKD
ncbi:DUF4365 domain-containing protein [bacterium]|nr:DUF4365 domain-containing protein [bacterium]